MSVTLIRIAGDDLDVVNNARVSFNREHTALTDKDRDLILDLVRDGHTEPLRGVWAKFKVECSIGCARQLMTHKRYMAINERSTRYSTFEDEFVTPPLKHQVGRALDYAYEPLHPDTEAAARAEIDEAYQRAYATYQQLLYVGVAKEDARSVLPLGMRTALIVSGDLAAWLRFLSRRTDRHAQDEIRSKANEIERILREHVPVTLAAWDATGRRPL
jgi:thymidylate synthase (FAD)